METLPSLFISHGAPTYLIDPTMPRQALATLGHSLARPRAIVVISAHWDTEIPTVSTMAQPDMIYDFYGFPDILYQQQYTAPGDPQLAMQIVTLLTAAGFPVETAERGYDHGAWVPLKIMFPAADIPVVTLSVQSRHSPEHHWRLGQALQSLAAQGVLILASGQIVHNLRRLDFKAEPDTPEAWAEQFLAWYEQKLEQRDTDTLLDYRQQAPHASLAHPTEEHLLPIYVALGAAGRNYAWTKYDWGFRLGSLSMNSYIFQASENRD